MDKKPEKKISTTSTVEVSLSQKEKTEILDQLFNEGMYSKKIDYIPGKAQVVIRNLSVKDQLAIEDKISAEKGNASYILHKYSYMILSKTLIGMQRPDAGNSMNEQQAETFLDGLPSPIIDNLLKEQRKLEAELQAALGVDVISENFSPEVDQLLDSEQSQEGSISENQEA